MRTSNRHLEDLAEAHERVREAAEVVGGGYRLHACAAMLLAAASMGDQVAADDLAVLIRDFPGPLAWAKPIAPVKPEELPAVKLTPRRPRGVNSDFADRMDLHRRVIEFAQRHPDAGWDEVYRGVANPYPHWNGLYQAMRYLIRNHGASEIPIDKRRKKVPA